MTNRIKTHTPPTLKTVTKEGKKKARVLQVGVKCKFYYILSFVYVVAVNYCKLSFCPDIVRVIVFVNGRRHYDLK